ncbi:GNAT family N-acetyltransferase [Hamadaea tsunoensis]|uniref:GNAT family N-acetyltransferase n=1 Tax=Hamadaea tsunoensis TaxID=53368 RepID=UPI0003F92C70|nr:GNAT family protein [Hamadaea tsunoensis]
MSSPYDSPQPTLHAVTDRGEKITLRVPESADADGLVAACTDPETLRWTTIAPDYDHDRAVGFITEYAPGWWQRRQGGCWVLAGPDGAYAGQIDLRVTADPQVADIGFLTAPPARGRGYMTAALRLVARYAIEELGLARVEWKAHVGNDASRRVAEKAGFTFEGVLRDGCAAHGRRFDAWIASYLPRDLVS